MTPNQRFDRRLRQIVQATRSPVPERERLDRLMREFRALHKHRSWLQRLSRWFALPHRLPAPAIALAAVVLVAQAVALLSLLPRTEPTEIYRGIAGVPCDDAARIRVVFKPDAPQSEVVILLRKVDATVTAGPSETGQLWLRVPPGRSIDEALAQLNASATVDEAILVPPAAQGCRP